MNKFWNVRDFLMILKYLIAASKPIRVWPNSTQTQLSRNGAVDSADSKYVYSTRNHGYEDIKRQYSTVRMIDGNTERGHKKMKNAKIT